jgi:putative membrane protein
MTGRTRDPDYQNPVYRNPDYIQPMELDPSGTIVVVPEERSTGPHLPGEPAEDETPEPVPAPRRWAVRLLVGSAAVLVALAVGYDTVDLVRRAFDTSMVLGIGAAALAAGTVVGAFGLLAG